MFYLTFTRYHYGGTENILLDLNRAVFGEIGLVIVNQPAKMKLTKNRIRPHVEPNNLFWKVLELSHKYGFGRIRKTIVPSVRQYEFKAVCFASVLGQNFL